MHSASFLVPFYAMEAGKVKLHFPDAFAIQSELNLGFHQSDVLSYIYIQNQVKWRTSKVSWSNFAVVDFNNVSFC